MNEELIRQIPIFSLLPEEEISYLIRVLKPREIAPDTVLFNEGDQGGSFSIILEGEVEVIKSLGTKDERLLSVEGKGSFLGEMSLLYPDQLRTASVRTKTGVSLLDMGREEFIGLMQREASLSMDLLRELVVRFHKSDSATISVLKEKNQKLTTAYEELVEAQEQLIEKEKMSHELQMARKIQEGTLPKKLPTLPGWQIATCWVPARQVSGDFYDFFEMEGGKLGIVVGDGTGKGVPAALVLATTRSVLRATASQLTSPGEVLERTNNLLCEEMPANMFVTCLFIILDPVDGSLIIANAGHNLPNLCTREGIQELRATGMPLGLLPGMKYEEIQCTMAGGERLLMYSDGLVEAHDPKGVMYGIPRLNEKLQIRYRGSKNGNAASLVKYLYNDLEEFTGQDWEQEDDVTLLVLGRD